MSSAVRRLIFNKAKALQKKDWLLTRDAFHQLLNWLDESADSSGYLKMRENLHLYFDRRNCVWPDRLADETLDRVARTLAEGVIIDIPPGKYCYLIANYVFKEYLRKPERKQEGLDDSESSDQLAQDPIAVANLNEERGKREKCLNCLERCAHNLRQDDRELIMQYYYGEQRVKIENRKALAVRLGVSIEQLRVRACRIRKNLETCVSKCVSS